MLGAKQAEVLDAVMQARRPVGLRDVADAVGLTDPPTHRHLQALLRTGHLVRERTGTEVLYRPRSRFAVDWTWTTEESMGRGEAPDDRWFRRTWESQDQPDWRFPLVSRIQDPKGRDATRRFLERAWEEGAFQPWLRNDHPADAYREGFMVIAYGSCVQGATNDRSDMDLLVMEPSDEVRGDAPSQREPLLSLADRINLGASRYIDLHVVPRDHVYFGGLPPGLWKSITEEGVTVFTSVAREHFVEDWAWHAASVRNGLAPAAEEDIQ